MANYQLVFTDRPSNSNDYRIPYVLDGLAPFVFKVISPTGELRGWQRAGTLIQIFAYGGPGDTRGRSASLRFEAYQFDWLTAEPFQIEHRPPYWLCDHTLELWVTV